MEEIDNSQNLNVIMKNNKLYLKIMMVALLVVVTSSCSDLFGDHDTSYQGSPKVEFTPLASTVTLYETEVDTNEAGPADNDTTSLEGTVEDVNVAVQLVGEQREEDLPLSVSVISEGETAAVEGLENGHYVLPSTSVTIPANSSSTQFTVNVTGDNLGVEETRQLMLELQSSSDVVEPAENLKRFTLTIVGGDTTITG